MFPTDIDKQKSKDTKNRDNKEPSNKSMERSK